MKANLIRATQSGYGEPYSATIPHVSYTAQDTYRAAWAWEIFFVPERIPAMVTSMLQDYTEVRSQTLPPDLHSRRVGF